MKALLLLYVLNVKATWRRLWNGMKTPKGAFLTCLMLFIVAMVVIPNLIFSFAMERRQLFDFGLYVPYGLFAYFVITLLTSIGDRAIYFTPSEVDNLFSAPFSRRELLGYKIIAWVAVAISMGMLFTVAFALHLNNPFFGLLGLSQTFLFLTLASMLVTLLRQIFSERLFTVGRQVTALIFLAAFALAMSQAVQQINLADLENFAEWLKQISASTMGQIVLAPFRVFSDAIFAKTISSFVLPMSLATLINIGLTIGILVLDANYLETAAGVSRKLYEKVERLQKGSIKISVRSTKWKIRMFPYLNGFGPMAWRQLVTAVRQGRSIFVVAAILSICFSIPVVLKVDNQFVSSPAVVAAAFGIMAYLTLIFSLSLPFGFRADIDHIEVFKSLPVKPFSIAAGELVGAVALFTVVHLFMILVGLLATRNFIEWWAVGLAFIVPFNILVVAISNTMFLSFPIRLTAGTKDIQAIGAGMMFMFFQAMIMVAVATFCVLPAMLTYWLTENVFLTCSMAWCLLVASTILSIYCTGRTYDRFDVTKIPA